MVLKNDPGWRPSPPIVVPNSSYSVGNAKFYILPPIGFLPPVEQLKRNLYGIV
jgi:hypothetical protein